MLVVATIFIGLLEKSLLAVLGPSDGVQPAMARPKAEKSKINSRLSSLYAPKT